MSSSPPADGFNGLIREALGLGREVRIKALGNSMHPLIPHGSVIELAPLPRAPRIGEIVAAQRGEKLLIHRVHAVDGTIITLMGDCSLRPDRPFGPRDILGVARKVVTPGGFQMRLDTLTAWAAGRALVRLTRARASLKRRIF